MANLSDLHDVMFNLVKKLDNDKLKGDELKDELERARVMTQVAGTIIQNGHLVLQAAKFKDDMWDADASLPGLLDGGTSEK